MKCSGIKSGHPRRVPHALWCSASVYDRSRAGDVPPGMFQSLDVPGTNQVGGEEGGGKTLHFEVGRGFEVRSSRFLELRTRNFELRLSPFSRFTRQRALRAIGGESLGEAMGQSDHAGRAVGRIEQHIHDMQAAGVG